MPNIKYNQQAVESAKYAASRARRAKDQLQESIKALWKGKIAPGMRGIKEIKEQQQKYNLIIPKAPFARVVREICMDGWRCVGSQMLLLHCRRPQKHTLCAYLMIVIFVLSTPSA